MAVVTGLVVAGCSDDPKGSGSAITPRSATTSPTTTVAPAMVDADGFTRLNVLPEPIASQVVEGNEREEPEKAKVELVQVRRVGDVVRVVVAWDLPTDPEANEDYAVDMSWVPDERKSPDRYEIGLALYDPAAGVLAEPLRTAENACLCSRNTRAVTSNDYQALYWADFPAPPSDTVTVLMGESVLPFNDVPISSDAPELQLPPDLARWVENEPPSTPGEGAVPQEPRAVRRSVQGYGGADDAQIGDKADVSLPADVLFALDSASLSKKATAVLADAARKLAVAAKGQRVQVVGHTDDQGSDAYNQKLSERRASAVVKALRGTLGGTGISLVPVGKGETEHLVPNVDGDGRPIEANRQRNRRVSFVFDRAEGGKRVDIATSRGLPKLPNARTTTASPNVSASVAAFLSQAGDARVDVVRAERVGDDVWLRLDFTATEGQAKWGSDAEILGKNPYGINETLGNVQLMDAKARTVSPPLTAGPGVCLCSEAVGAGRLFERPISMWAVFPAPEDDVDLVTLRVPGFGQFVDVPLS